MQHVYTQYVIHQVTCIFHMDVNSCNVFYFSCFKLYDKHIFFLTFLKIKSTWKNAS